MSVLLKRGPLSQPAASTRPSATLQIMVDQERGEESSKIEDRIAEGLLRERIGIRAIDAPSIGQEDAPQRERGGEIQPAAHPHHERKQAHREKNQGIEQD